MRMALPSASKKGIFLDRDGVLSKVVFRGEKPCSARTLEEFEIFPFAAACLERLHRAGYVLLVITNQPDIARGKMALETLEGMNRILLEKLGGEAGVRKVYFCPHDGPDLCPCRKPQPGMILQGAKEWGLDLKQSFVIGDRETDAEAGKNAGCKTLLLRTPFNTEARPDYWAKDLHEACQMILSLDS